MLGRLF